MEPSGPAVWALVEQAGALVFDFDGTLVQSVPIKRQALEACFAEFSDDAEAITTYCGTHPHTPRSEKFRFVYEQIVRQPYTDAVAARLHTRFEAATTRQIIHAPEVPGATALLCRAAERQDVGVLSSTPQAVLEQIISARGWARWCSAIQGAPVNKAAWLAARPRAAAAVYFGDTVDDAEAAREAGWTFVGVADPAVRAVARYWVEDFLWTTEPLAVRR